MKTIGLLLTIVSVTLVTGGRGYATPAAAAGSAPALGQRETPLSGSNRQNDVRAGGAQRNAPSAADKTHPRTTALATKPTHPQQVAKDQRRPAPGNIIGVRPWAPAQSHSEAAAKLNHGATQNEAIYRALPVQPNGVVRPAAPPAGNVRHRDPNAGVLGGVTTSNNRTTAAIDGSRTNLRSYLRN